MENDRYFSKTDLSKNYIQADTCPSRRYLEHSVCDHELLKMLFGMMNLEAILIHTVKMLMKNLSATTEESIVPKGLQFSWDRKVSTSTDRRQACGILTCEESTPHHSENSITGLSVFKKQQSGPIASDKPGRGNLMASVTLNQLLIAQESDSVKINGRLEAGRASLHLELVTKEGCSAEYTCEVRMLDSQEKESINTYHLLQQHDLSVSQGDEAIATSAGSLHVLLLLQQLDTKLEMMGSSFDSKIGSVENRLEDKNERIMDKLCHMENSLSPVNDAVSAEGQEDLERLLTELLAWQQTSQCECKNLTLAVQQVLNSTEGLASNVNDKIVPLCKGQGDFQQLRSDINNVSTGTHDSIENAFSKTDVPLRDGLSLISESFGPKACRKGMINVSTHAPFPYPLIFPSTETSFSFPYLCDLITDGGWWIVIQRRTTGNIDFYRDWATYKKGFGSLDDDFWMGNDNIHTITSSGNYELRVDLKYQGKSAFAHYSKFSIDDEDNNYTLRLGDYDGTAGDSLGHHKGRPFSAFDRDNDALSHLNCALRYSGAWWYKDCHRSNLNGKWLAVNNKGPRWYTFSVRAPVSYSEMKIRKS
ncbi:tenascin-r [Plakobranchus ocellatus]|uniref:Tenascin-r n=1 Tax=Plakobranchus ocellatus TaxID=259542 RepID=A0AAV4CZ60_9GAST|nr:tenascin-r [Plakobranchus ocellatus]